MPGSREFQRAVARPLAPLRGRTGAVPPAPLAGSSALRGSVFSAASAAALVHDCEADSLVAAGSLAAEPAAQSSRQEASRSRCMMAGLGSG